MPVAAGTLLARLLLGPDFIGLYALCSASIFGVIRGGSLTYALFALAGSLVVGRRAARIAHRRQLLKVGAYLASTNVAVLLSCELLSGRLTESRLFPALVAAILGALTLTPILVGAALPVFEALFGYVSDTRLAELCNLNHPALKELIVRAPGTYHHSILLAGLAESAARKVSADPFLAKAIGLYHDLGKAKAPLTFSENQKAPRPDLAVGTELVDAMVRHIPEGVDLARRYKLPRLLIEAIAQHHGTRRVGLCLESVLQGEPPLHYPGPKPRRSETAIVLLADAVEAQSRKLNPRDVPKLHEQVSATVAQIASEGQLDDSGLTFGQLQEIVESFVEDLTRTLVERGPELPAPLERPTTPRTQLELN